MKICSWREKCDSAAKPGVLILFSEYYTHLKSTLTYTKSSTDQKNVHPFSRKLGYQDKLITLYIGIAIHIFVLWVSINKKTFP